MFVPGPPGTTRALRGHTWALTSNYRRRTIPEKLPRNDTGTPMIAAPAPPNEERRLRALHGVEILDTPAEKAFDDLVRLAAYVCETPIAAVSFVDHDRQWFKAKVGLEVPETKRDISFCAHAVTLPDEPLIVPDASLDVRFSDNPLVTGEPKIRFYAGAPLVTEDGLVLGTLCVIDHVPKELSAAQIKALTVLRNQVMRELELHRKNIELSEANKKLEQAGISLSEDQTRNHAD
jgi:GAF domain-containing protein